MGENEESEADQRYRQAGILTLEREEQRNVEVIRPGPGQWGQNRRTVPGPERLCFTCDLPRSSHPGYRFC